MVSLMGNRLSSLLGQGLSYILGHLLITLAFNVEMLLAGRFICGLCQGFCNTLTIVYVLDLCDSLQSKAICGVLLSLVGNAGTLTTYTLGIFLNWRQLAASLLAFALPYIFGLLLVLPNDIPAKKPSKKCLYITSKGCEKMEKGLKKAKTSSIETFFDVSDNLLVSTFALN